MSHTSPDDLAIAEIMRIAHELTGVQLADRHRSMVAARLQKRVSELGLKNFSEYLAFFKENRTSEQTRLIGMITTHHTFFFREFSHFEYLVTALPALIAEALQRPEKKIRIWAAACSRGQEVYSLAMFFDFHLKRLDASVGFEILGSDIDRESVAVAENGVYLRQELKEAPLALLADHWVRGTGDIEAYVKVRASLKKNCRFEVRNLLDLKAEVIPVKFDVIFCRNVFIYFNAEQITSITSNLMSRLDPKGYFFVGISESLAGLKLALESQGPSVYCIPQKITAPVQSKVTALTSAPRVVLPAKQKTIRVLCVDDSSSILTLLKQILGTTHGFEIVGTAMNGIEAAKKVIELKPDVMTLDIHMPEQTGIEYLEKNFRAGHPPVLMITSVAREDASLAGKALSLGAGDYVEKPALSNLAERGEEIRAKLKCLSAMTTAPVVRSTLDKAFQTKRVILKTDDKLRVFALSLSHREKLKQVLRELPDPQPACILLIEGAGGVLGEMAKMLTRETGRNITHADTIPDEFKSNQIVLMDLAMSAKHLADRFSKKKSVSIMAFGEISRPGCDQLLKFVGANWVLEDLGNGVCTSGLKAVANDIVLSTSFAYLSQEYFYSVETKKKAA